MISSRITCFTLVLIFSNQVSATDEDITDAETLKKMGTLIRSVGYACVPAQVFDTGIIHGKHFYSVRCQDGQSYVIATPPEGKISDVDITDATYMTDDDVDWQKSEWINTIIRNTESLDNVSKSHPDILE